MLWLIPETEKYDNEKSNGMYRFKNLTCIFDDKEESLYCNYGIDFSYKQAHLYAPMHMVTVLHYLLKYQDQSNVIY